MLSKLGDMADDMLNNRMLAFDIGTEKVRAWERKKGLIVFSPEGETDEERYTTANATARGVADGRDLLAVGDDALKLQGRSLKTRVQVRQPYNDGAIRVTDEDHEAVRDMLEYGLEVVYGKFGSWRRTSSIGPSFPTTILTAITHCSTTDEQKSLENTIRELNCLPRIVGQPVATAIGAGIPVHEIPASFLVDIGGGTTGVAVISMYNIAAEPVDYKIGSRKISWAIIDGIRDDLGMLVGPPTAEFLKRNLLTLGKISYDESRVVRGKPIQGGKAEPIKISQRQLQKWVRPLLMKELVEPLRIYLEDLTPELHADIQERHIQLAGGGSLVKEFDEFLTEEVGIKVEWVENPMFSLIIGLGKMLNDPKLLKLAEQSLLSENEKRMLKACNRAEEPDSSAQLVVRAPQKLDTTIPGIPEVNHA
ncbi:MAG TPA: rod shape-determining protein [Patescibacteria group bacterium]